MANIEMVEKLRERAQISYEEARAALDACNDDLLEALIYLERQGKVKAPDGGSYSSKNEPRENQIIKIEPQKERKRESFGDMLNRFFSWCGRVIHKGNTNCFEVWKNDQRILSVPVTVLILLLLFAFWITLPLLILGLFLSCRYQFKGREIESINVNSVMDSAKEAAETLKNEVRNAAYQDRDQK